MSRKRQLKAQHKRDQGPKVSHQAGRGWYHHKDDNAPWMPNPWAKKSGPVKVREATPEERERLGLPALSGSGLGDGG